jgi:ribonucleases P/MRP protein subunit RPP40
MIPRSPGKLSLIMTPSILQKDLDQLCFWAATWEINSTLVKCKVMYFGSTNTHKVYNMNGAVLDSVSVEKDLGVLVDRNLNLSTHTSSAIHKANRLLGLIKRCFRYLDMKGLKLLYTAIVHPHLKYANAVWHPRFKKDIKLLEKVQHRATRLIPELHFLPYKERLRHLKLPSLTYRRL